MTVEEKGQAILMEIFDIKRGDILVAKYNDAEQYEFERDYIIFIASGSSLSGIIYDKYISYSIPVIACINLSNTLEVETNLSIGFIINNIEEHKTITIKKPTFSEMVELINRLKENGYKYNKKTKNIEKL